MRLNDYLREIREQMPAWLQQFQAGQAFSRQQFFASRVVYYPGCGTDGHPVKVFGSTRSAHCFVYTDYGLSRADVESELDRSAGRFRGYHTLARVDLSKRDLSPHGWTPHLKPAEVWREQYQFARAQPFGFLEVLERDRELDDGHGADRLAILFLGADGINTYDALFCQQDSVSPPFAVVVQDHGSGGNYDRFGRGGLLERVARRCKVSPQWLLVAEYTDPWPGFVRVPGVDGDCGGMHATLRFLHERESSHSWGWD